MMCDKAESVRGSRAERPLGVPTESIDTRTAKLRLHKDIALRIHRLSLARYAQFQGDIPRDPTWDVLLSLFIAQAEGLDVPFASLCTANRLSSAKCEETVQALVSSLLALWKPVDACGTRRHVELTPRGMAHMNQFLQRVALTA